MPLMFRSKATTAGASTRRIAKPDPSRDDETMTRDVAVHGAGPGEQVARRSLDSYDAVARHLARQEVLPR